jgi:rubrerythrin
VKDQRSYPSTKAAYESKREAMELRLRTSDVKVACRSRRLRLQTHQHTKQGRRLERLVRREKRINDNVALVEHVNHVCKICGHVCNFIRSYIPRL